MKIIVNEKHMYLRSYTNETNKNIIFFFAVSRIQYENVAPIKGKNVGSGAVNSLQDNILIWSPRAHVVRLRVLARKSHT